MVLDEYFLVNSRSSQRAIWEKDGMPRLSWQLGFSSALILLCKPSGNLLASSSEKTS
jgi:hypothetical protein